MRRLLLPAWCTGLVLVLLVLHLVGDTGIALPRAVVDWPAWVDQVGPAVAIAAVLRLASMGLAWYLVVATVIGAGARALGQRRAVATADALTPRFLRRLLASAGGLAVSGAGLTLAAAPIAVGVDGASSAQPVAAEPAPRAEFTRLGPIRVPVGSGATEPELAPPGQVEVDDEASTADFAVLDLTDLGGALSAGAASDSQDESVWEVACGDHFWAIAEEFLEDELGSPPDDETVTRYWRSLIDANRDRLVAPDNPDLLLVGQVLTIPSPGTAN